MSRSCSRSCAAKLAKRCRGTWTDSPDHRSDRRSQFRPSMSLDVRSHHAHEGLQRRDLPGGRGPRGSSRYCDHERYTSDLLLSDPLAPLAGSSIPPLARARATRAARTRRRTSRFSPVASACALRAERAAAPRSCRFQALRRGQSDITNLVWSHLRSRRAGHLSAGTPTESPGWVTTGRSGGCDARRLNPPSQPPQARSDGCPTSNGPESMPTVTDRHTSRGPASLAAQILAESAARLRQDQSPIRADLAARSGRPRRRTVQPQSSWRLQPRSRSTP